MAACKDDVSTTGESVLDEDDAIIVLADTFSLISAIDSCEAIISQADSFLLGEIETDYGLLNASILTQLACPVGYTYPEGFHVDSVDSSQRAMDMVDRNVALNGFTAEQHTSYCADAIDFVKNVPDGAYDLMIVDPPAFAKHRGALKNALRAYQRLNAAAIAKVAPGGFVFTFSCSQVVDKEAFALAVFSAAAETGRSVRILDRLNQPADHSVIYHPEGEYLKGLLLYVE